MALLHEDHLVPSKIAPLFTDFRFLFAAFSFLRLFRGLVLPAQRDYVIERQCCRRRFYNISNRLLRLFFSRHLRLFSREQNILKMNSINTDKNIQVKIHSILSNVPK